MSGGLPESWPVRQSRVRQYPGPVESTVHSVTAEGLFVTLDHDRQQLVGPCRWSRPLDHAHPDAGEFAYGDPPRGTGCLVLFADTGIARPWVVAFDGWPA